MRYSACGNVLLILLFVADVPEMVSLGQAFLPVPFQVGGTDRNVCPTWLESDRQQGLSYCRHVRQW